MDIMKKSLLTIAVVSLSCCIFSQRFGQSQAEESENVNPFHISYPQDKWEEMVKEKILNHLQMTKPLRAAQPLPQLPSHLMRLPSEEDKDDAKIKALPRNRGLVYETDEQSPSLEVTQTPSLVRKRRGSDNASDTNCECCVVDRIVNFTNYSWGEDIIVYPEVKNLRACAGKCPYSLSTFDMSYGMIMNHVVKNNEVCVPQCQPSRMSRMRIIYKEGKQIVVTDVQDMVVKSCACMTTNCHRT